MGLLSLFPRYFVTILYIYSSVSSFNSTELTVSIPMEYAKSWDIYFFTSLEILKKCYKLMLTIIATLVFIHSTSGAALLASQDRRHGGRAGGAAVRPATESLASFRPVP